MQSLRARHSHVWSATIALLTITSAAACRPTCIPLTSKGCVGQPGCEPCGRWAFKELRYSAPELNPNGGTWDKLFDTDPDPFATIEAGAQRRALGTYENAYQATWVLRQWMRIDAGETVTIEVYDADITDHDLIESAVLTMPGTLENATLVFGDGAGRLRGRCVRRAEPGTVSP